MSRFRKIAHNTLLQITSRVIGVGLNVVVFSMLARYLSPKGFGEFSIVIAFVQIFASLSELGLSIIAMQFLSEHNRKDQNRDFQILFTLRVICAAIILFFGSLAAWFFPYSVELKIGIAIIAISFFVSSLSQFISLLYQIRLSMGIPFLADLAAKIILIVGIPILFMKQGSLLGVFIIVVINNCVQLCILIFHAKTFFPLTFAWDKAIIKETFFRCWPLALSSLFTLLYFKMDTVILSLFTSPYNVGLYSAAYRVLEVLIGFPVLFIGLVFPFLSKSWSSGNEKEFFSYYQKVFDFICLLAFPLLIGTLFTAREVMVFISGDDFLQSGTILMILIFGAFFIFFGALYTTLIPILHQQRKMLIGSMIAAIGGIAVYFYTIPHYSYWGAAWTTVAIELFITSIAVSIVTWKTKMVPSLSMAGKILFSSLFMGLFLYAFPSLHIIGKLGMAVGVYAVVLILLGVISKKMLQEIASFKKLPSS